MCYCNCCFVIIVVVGVVFVGVIVLVMFVMKDVLIYFYFLIEIVEEGVDIGECICVGGFVVEGLIQLGEGQYVVFCVIDMVYDILIEYDGILLDLFCEGQGVVVEGVFQIVDVFLVEIVLVKYDEIYMFFEVVEVLQESGVWQGEGDNGESEY